MFATYRARTELTYTLERKSRPNQPNLFRPNETDVRFGYMSRIISGMSESRYTTVVMSAESEHTSITNPVLTKYKISTLIAEFVCLNGERAL